MSSWLHNSLAHSNYEIKAFSIMFGMISSLTLSLSLPCSTFQAALSYSQAALSWFRESLVNLYKSNLNSLSSNKIFVTYHLYVKIEVVPIGRVSEASKANNCIISLSPSSDGPRFWLFNFNRFFQRTFSPSPLSL